jgi:hypothetical protein
VKEVMKEERYPYGAVKASIREWIENLPVGREFHYGEIAEELEIPRPSVSGTVLKMARTDPEPLIVFGKQSAWYTRVEPRLRPELAGLTIDTGQKKPRNPGSSPQADDLMTVVGMRKDGRTLMLRDENGELWEAVKA